MRYFSIPLVIGLCACASTSAGPKDAPPPLPVYTWPKTPPDPAPSVAPGVTLIRGARVMTADAAGTVHDPGYVLVKDGRIDAVGAGDIEPPPGARVLDATGKTVTPGLIDTHSHLGVYPMPHVAAHADGNEMTARTTPKVWAEHGFWPQDPGLWRAVAGGVTTIQVLPGSANLIGGRSYVAKLKPGVSARAMRFPGAPQGLKMACGENPKRVYGERGGPQTRMGNTAWFRVSFQQAQEYRRKVQKFERDLEEWKKKHEKWEKNERRGESPGDPPEPPPRDFDLESLALVLDGKVLVHNHCYRADEMSKQLDLAREFGFSIRSFHHALEAYKIRDRLAKENVAASTWADWWGFKMEAFDGVPQNLAMLSAAGARAVVHSDSSSDVRRLNQEAMKAATYGRQVGLSIDATEVLRWITANPAWAIGVHEQTGTLEPGKMADVVVWSGDPFSVYTLADVVLIDGEVVFDRARDPRVSDFELGHGGAP